MCPSAVSTVALQLSYEPCKEGTLSALRTGYLLGPNNSLLIRNHIMMQLLRQRDVKARYHTTTATLSPMVHSIATITLSWADTNGTLVYLFNNTNIIHIYCVLIPKQTN